MLSKDGRRTITDVIIKSSGSHCHRVSDSAAMKERGSYWVSWR